MAPFALVLLGPRWVGASGLEAGVGAALGGTVTTNDFDFTASPILAARYDPFPWKVRPTFGVATFPTFLYLPTPGSDYSVAPLVVAELGLVYGTETHRVGLLGHAGLFSFGAGIQYTLLAWKFHERVDTGFELRAMWLAQSAMYFGAMWTLRFDPETLLDDPVSDYDTARR